MTRCVTIFSIIVSIVGFLTYGQVTETTVIGRAAPLRKIIEREQRENVKESRGEPDGRCFTGRCFTADDYDQFKRKEVARQIALRLKHSPDFISAVARIRAIDDPTERAKALDELRKPLRPTWAELGSVTSAGQTEAGNQAERDLANAIVNAADELAKLSEADFRKLRRR